MPIRRPSPLPLLLALAAAVAVPLAGVKASVAGGGGPAPSDRTTGHVPSDRTTGNMPEAGLPVLQSGQLAQYSPVPPRGRVVADHDHAREATRAGENRGFEELMRSAQSRGRGEYLGVEPDIGRNIYRFKFLRSGGNVVWVDVDGRTGRVVAERD